MKQVIIFFRSLKSIKGIAKAFVVFNMGISYFDSTSFFYDLYNLSFQTIGLSVLLLTYLLIIYWKKVAVVTFNSSLKKYFIILKWILFLILITPIFFDGNWQIVKFNELENIHIIRVVVELIKILFAELIIKILFQIINCIKEK